MSGPLQSLDEVYNTFKGEAEDLLRTTYNVIAVNTKHMVTVPKLVPSLPNALGGQQRFCGSFVYRNASGAHYEEERFMVELSDAGDIVGIDLLDFIVMGACNFASGRIDTIL